MAEGPGAHEQVERELSQTASQDGRERPVVSSAGALVRTLQYLGLKKVVAIAPYSPDLTDMVLNYISGYGIEISDYINLNVTDNQAVGRLDPSGLPELVQRLNLSGADGIILSSCVQMPSLPAVAGVQSATGLPVVTAATATARELLRALHDDRVIKAGGAAIDGSAEPSGAPQGP
jgi:maleate isomerase